MKVIDYINEKLAVNNIDQNSIEFVVIKNKYVSWLRFVEQCQDADFLQPLNDLQMVGYDNKFVINYSQGNWTFIIVPVKEDFEYNDVDLFDYKAPERKIVEFKSWRQDQAQKIIAKTMKEHGLELNTQYNYFAIHPNDDNVFPLPIEYFRQPLSFIKKSKLYLRDNGDTVWLKV